MGIVRHYSDGTEPITEEDIAMDEELKNSPIDYSDIPDYSREELREMRRYAEEKLKKSPGVGQGVYRKYYLNCRNSGIASKSESSIFLPLEE